MATKPNPFAKAPPFGAKETKREEKAEKKSSPAAYKRGEKAEGVHGKKAPPFLKKK